MGTIAGLFSQFGVTWGQLAGQLITFVVLLVLLRMFLYKPVLGMLEERKERIAQGLRDAEAAARARSAGEERALETTREANAKAEVLLAQTKEAAERLKQELAEATQTELAAMRTAHEQQLALMKQEMLNQVRQEMAQLVVLTSQKVLQRQLTKDDKRQLTKAAAKEIQ